MATNYEGSDEEYAPDFEPDDGYDGYGHHQSSGDPGSAAYPPSKVSRNGSGGYTEGKYSEESKSGGGGFGSGSSRSRK